MYCVKCRKATGTGTVSYVITKNGRNMARGKCLVCGTTKTQFVKSMGAKPKTAKSKTSKLKTSKKKKKKRKI